MLAAAQVAEQLGISARKVYDLHAAGDLRGYRFGRAVRFEQMEVDAYVAQCRTPLPPVMQASMRSEKLHVVLPGTESELQRAFRIAGLKPRRTPLASIQREKMNRAAG
jgi:excisionase family DNA binding protein